MPRIVDPSASRARALLRTPPAPTPAVAAPTKRNTIRSAYGNEEHQEETLERTRLPAGAVPCLVQVGAGKTINTGDFSSLRIDVMVQVPYDSSNPETMEDAYQTASQFAAEKLEQEEANWFGTGA